MILFFIKKILFTYNLLGDFLKNFFKLILLSSFIVFSFYYTNRVALLVKNNNPMVKKIKKVQKKYKVKSVDAIIKKDTIVPGLNGKQVNIDKSSSNMNKLGYFNDLYLVYDAVVPRISLENNKDKIIIKGNENKNSVTIICEDNDILNYFIKNNIVINTNYKLNTRINKKVSYYNSENNEEKFNNVESFLKIKKMNNNICLLNNNYDLCKKYQKYIVMPSIVLNKNNIIDVKNNIQSGDIIFIKGDAKISDIKIMIKAIFNNNLDIVDLNTLIKEDNY